LPLLAFEGAAVLDFTTSVFQAVTTSLPALSLPAAGSARPPTPSPAPASVRNVTIVARREATLKTTTRIPRLGVRAYFDSWSLAV
jgi:hypothetical protein